MLFDKKKKKLKKDIKQKRERNSRDLHVNSIDHFSYLFSHYSPDRQFVLFISPPRRVKPIGPRKSIYNANCTQPKHIEGKITHKRLSISTKYNNVAHCADNRIHYIQHLDLYVIYDEFFGKFETTIRIKAIYS